jgi:hypothetical protein
MLMPFTPFHFGPGLFFKALIPRWFSMSAFVATQVVIDVETLYYLIAREYPFHRTLHTLVGSTLTGLAVAGMMVLGRRVGERIVALVRLPRSMADVVGTETTPTAILAGCVTGGASHTVLDGLLHTDVRPLGPWQSGNPMIGLIEPQDLHLLCVGAGLAGAVILSLWLWSLQRAG